MKRLGFAVVSRRRRTSAPMVLFAIDFLRADARARGDVWAQRALDKIERRLDPDDEHVEIVVLAVRR